MEFKDLTGLSKPLTKFVSVCSKGLGKVYEPTHVRRLAKASATAKLIMQEAENKALVSKEENCLEINQMKKEYEAKIFHKEHKRQENVEIIMGRAYEKLKDKDEVSEEELDEDWITRFFRYAEDITTEHMQELWAKILAGEIEKPKSFSMRTLEILRNMSTEEAEIFQKFVNLSIKAYDDEGRNNHLFILYEDNSTFNNLITFNDILLMMEIGIIHEGLSLNIEPTNQERFSIKDNDIVFSVNRIIVIRIISFSKKGIELLRLIEQKVPEGYTEYIVNEINKNPEIKFLSDVKLSKA